MHINEFDVWTLLTCIQQKRKRICINCLIAGALGFAIASCIPKEYTSSASLVPESNDEETSLAGGMDALASMAGIKMGTVDAISPDIYPKVVASNEFIVKLLQARVETIDGSVKTNYFTYLRKYNREPWWGMFGKWFARIMKTINPQPVFTPQGSSDDGINPHRMSREDEQLVEGVKNIISCTSEEKTGVINISFRAQDPLVAKTMLDTLSQELQSFITAYRTGKARNDLEYYRELEKETRITYDQTLRNYANYCDSHKGGLLQAYQSEMESLENEMQLAMSAYTQVKKQVQMAEAKVQEKTPAFTIVEGAAVANRHTSPRKMLMTLGWMFITFVGTLGWIYVRLLFDKEK